jgi:hypothetical protein
MFNVTLSEPAPTTVQVETVRGRREGICRRGGKREGDGGEGTSREAENDVQKTQR